MKNKTKNSRPETEIPQVLTEEAMRSIMNDRDTKHVFK